MKKSVFRPLQRSLAKAKPASEQLSVRPDDPPDRQKNRIEEEDIKGHRRQRLGIILPSDRIGNELRREGIDIARGLQRCRQYIE